MKLCIVTHKFVLGDGQGRVNYEVALAAAKRGHEVTLLAQEVCSTLIQHPNVRWIPIAGQWLPSTLLRTLFFSHRCSRWLRSHRDEFDLLQVNGTATAEAGDINAVHFVHSTWWEFLTKSQHPWHHPKLLYQWVFTGLNVVWEKRTLPKARRLVAVSRNVEQDLINLGVPAQRIIKIFNGVDLQKFHPGTADRIQLGLPNQSTLALFVGDIRSNRKNLDTVLQAMLPLTDLQLAVVGGVDRSPYPAMVKQMGLADRVHFLGYRRDIADLMRACDFFVFPSRYEPFGMVICEAMACGLPVITGANSGAAELLETGAGIVLSDPEDVPSLIHALMQLTHNPQFRQQMGQAASTVVQAYSWGLVSDSYIQLFEQEFASLATNEAATKATTDQAAQSETQQSGVIA